MEGVRWGGDQRQTKRNREMEMEAGRENECKTEAERRGRVCSIFT